MLTYLVESNDFGIEWNPGKSPLKYGSNPVWFYWNRRPTANFGYVRHCLRHSDHICSLRLHPARALRFGWRHHHPLASRSFVSTPSPPPSLLLSPIPDIVVGCTSGGAVAGIHARLCLFMQEHEPLTILDSSGGALESRRYSFHQGVDKQLYSSILPPRHIWLHALLSDVFLRARNQSVGLTKTFTL